MTNRELLHKYSKICSTDDLKYLIKTNKLDEIWMYFQIHKVIPTDLDLDKYSFEGCEDKNIIMHILLENGFQIKNNAIAIDVLGNFLISISESIYPLQNDLVKLVYCSYREYQNIFKLEQIKNIYENPTIDIHEKDILQLESVESVSDFLEGIKFANECFINNCPNLSSKYILPKINIIR